MNEENSQPRIFILGMYLAGVAILLMMTITVLDVILKNLFASSIPGSYLYMENILMPLAIFLGMPYAFFSGIFPRLDMVVNKFKKSTRINIVIFVLILELLAFLVIIYYSFMYGIFGATTNITFLAGINSIPLYPMFFLVTLAFTLIAAYLAKVIWTSYKENKEPDFFADMEEVGADYE